MSNNFDLREYTISVVKVAMPFFGLAYLLWRFFLPGVYFTLSEQGVIFCYFVCLLAFFLLGIAFADAKKSRRFLVVITTFILIRSLSWTIFLPIQHYFDFIIIPINFRFSEIASIFNMLSSIFAPLIYFAGGLFGVRFAVSKKVRLVAIGQFGLIAIGLFSFIAPFIGFV